VVEVSGMNIGPVDYESLRDGQMVAEAEFLL
jgi:hypothetical protein